MKVKVGTNLYEHLIDSLDRGSITKRTFPLLVKVLREIYSNYDHGDMTTSSVSHTIFRNINEGNLYDIGGLKDCDMFLEDPSDFHLCLLCARNGMGCADGGNCEVRWCHPSGYTFEHNEKLRRILNGDGIQML